MPSTVKVDFYKSSPKDANLESFKGLVSHALPGLHAYILDALRRCGHLENPGSLKVIDLGAGQGALSARFAECGCRVLACDYVSENFAASEFGIEFRCLDLNQDFADLLGAGSADIVSAVEIIEHIENPRHLLRECRKLLRPGGVLVLTTPNIDSSRSKTDFMAEGIFHMFRDSSYRSSGHITPIGAWQLDKMAEEARLRTEQHTTFGNESYTFRERPKAFLLQSFIERFGRRYPWGDGAIHVLLLSPY